MFIHLYIHIYVYLCVCTHIHEHLCMHTGERTRLRHTLETSCIELYTYIIFGSHTCKYIIHTHTRTHSRTQFLSLDLYRFLSHTHTHAHTHTHTHTWSLWRSRTLRCVCLSSPPHLRMSLWPLLSLSLSHDIAGTSLVCVCVCGVCV